MQIGGLPVGDGVRKYNRSEHIDYRWKVKEMSELSWSIGERTEKWSNFGGGQGG